MANLLRGKESSARRQLPGSEQLGRLARAKAISPLATDVTRIRALTLLVKGAPVTGPTAALTAGRRLSTGGATVTTVPAGNRRLARQACRDQGHGQQTKTESCSDGRCHTGDIDPPVCARWGKISGPAYLAQLHSAPQTLNPPRAVGRPGPARRGRGSGGHWHPMTSPGP